jgi:hypothetical protein
MSYHSVCGTKLEIDRAESPMGYAWWFCQKCNRRVPTTEIVRNLNQSRGDK